MRKGEKLLDALWIRSKKYDNPYNSGLIRDAQSHENMLRYLNEMSDEEFNKIVYDVENNENWVEGYEIGKGT